MEKWEKFKIFSGSLAAVLIPLALAFIGNGYSQALKEREMQGRFVELAVSILRETPTPQTENIRGWAVDVLNEYSGVQLGAGAKNDLIRKHSLRDAIYGGGKKLINVDAMKEICWREAGVAADTLIMDFLFLPDFDEERKVVTNCMDNLLEKGVITKPIGVDK